MPQCITDNIEISSKFNREDSVEENSNKKKSDEEHFNKEN